MNYKYLKNRVTFFGLLIKADILIKKDTYGLSQKRVEEVNKRVDNAIDIAYAKIIRMKKEDKNKEHKT
ncbi:MAG: hypothetical protein ABW148_18585 [Sedimenticola sp.]